MVIRQNFGCLGRGLGENLSQKVFVAGDVVLVVDANTGVG